MPGGGSNRTGSAKAVRSAFATGHDQRGSVLISAGFIVIWPADYRQKQSGTVRWREVGLNWLSLRQQGQRRFAIEGTARWRRELPQLDLDDESVSAMYTTIGGSRKNGGDEKMRGND
ncbi:unnamed protein product [Heligmosomoides polygyrus]|uniref:Transposase n=1 Tax=Heligmosomoides polygyrus TaxID=6339 RepID=A0A183FG09_HELPZ|nr:unnamed protein product [Heligmosomoides polygyrus]